MENNKSNKIFSNCILVSTILILFTSLYLETSPPLNIIDILFVFLLTVCFALTLILKEKYYNTIILFYDFILVSSIFIFNLKVTILIIIITLLFYSILLYFKDKVIINTSSNRILIEGFTIIISLFLTKGAILIFSELIKDSPTLFVQVIIMNLFYHLFYYIINSLEFLFKARNLKHLKLWDSINLILLNFIYSTVITYLALTLYLLLGYFPLIVLVILNTFIAILFINLNKKNTYFDNILFLNEAIITSLQGKVDIFQKFYSYLDAMNKILPSTLMGIYFLYGNQKNILPLCHKCENIVEVIDLQFNNIFTDNLMHNLEAGTPFHIKGENLNLFFPFIKKLNMTESTFIIIPLTLNTKVLGFTLIHSRYINYEKYSLDLLSKTSSCISLLIDQNLKIIQTDPIKLDSFDALLNCIKKYINSKLTFTLSKIYLEINDHQLDFRTKEIQEIILSSLKNSQLAKVLFFNKDTFYLISSLKDSLNANESILDIKNLLEQSLDISISLKDLKYSNMEYPTDANTFFEFARILN